MQSGDIAAPLTQTVAVPARFINEHLRSNFCSYCVVHVYFCIVFEYKILSLLFTFLSVLLY